MIDILKYSVIKYLNSEYGDLEQFKIPEYTNHLFFMKDGKAIIEYNKQNKQVYISDDRICSFLNSFFGLDYREIQELTKIWVVESHKLRVMKTSIKLMHGHSWVEERYRLKTYERESQT